MGGAPRKRAPAMDEVTWNDVLDLRLLLQRYPHPNTRLQALVEAVIQDRERLIKDLADTEANYDEEKTSMNEEIGLLMADKLRLEDELSRKDRLVANAIAALDQAARHLNEAKESTKEQ